MALERLRFANMEKWGNLVKRWATGAQPRPTTLAEFKAQCVAADVGATIPGYITEFEMVQTPRKERLLLRLPPKELVQDTEADLNAGGAYSIPGFYNQLFDRPAGIPPNMPTDTAGKLRVHAQRIGDYTMSFCA